MNNCLLCNSDKGYTCKCIGKTDNNLKEQTVQEGIKHDQGKPDPTFLSWDMVEAVSQVRAFGAVKYSPFNWMKGFKYRRSAAAALRHIFQFMNGEDLDKESGLPHIAHAICCLEHLLYDFKYHPQNDDRYKNEAKE